jgi:uncharacterized PurR-regulated membrane protein YhhQ (DUF165 family)
MSNRWVKLGTLSILYIAAVVAANLLVKHYGPQAAPAIAFVAVAAVLIFRDRFADLVGSRTTSQILQAALIGVGAIATYLLNSDAALIAKASVIAFVASELTEQVLYLLMRNRPWMERAPWAAVPAALVDSVLFITIAFGFSFWIIAAQFGCKVGGAYLWANVIDRLGHRRVKTA